MNRAVLACMLALLISGCSRCSENTKADGGVDAGVVQSDPEADPCPSEKYDVEMTFPGKDPGGAAARVSPGELVLYNQALRVSWHVTDGVLTPSALEDLQSGETLALKGEAFRILLQDGRAVKASDLRVVGAPAVEAAPANCASPRIAEHHAGKVLVVNLQDAAGNLQVEWRATLRNGGSYLRQGVTFRATQQPVPLQEVALVDVLTDQGVLTGTVDGSPVMRKTFFFGYEHPMWPRTASATRPSAWAPGARPR
jgi:hypothetical protein